MKTTQELEQDYIDFLNESIGTIKIGKLEFDPADIIKALDPIAFRCGLADYESMLIDDLDFNNDIL